MQMPTPRCIHPSIRRACGDLGSIKDPDPLTPGRAHPVLDFTELWFALELTALEYPAPRAEPAQCIAVAPPANPAGALILFPGENRSDHERGIALRFGELARGDVPRVDQKARDDGIFGQVGEDCFNPAGAVSRVADIVKRDFVGDIARMYDDRREQGILQRIDGNALEPSPLSTGMPETLAEEAHPERRTQHVAALESGALPRCRPGVRTRRGCSP